MKRIAEVIVIALLSLFSLVAVNPGVAHADVPTITWAPNALPQPNELGLNEDFPFATSSSGAPITYTILDANGSNCSYIGNYFYYGTGGYCYIRASVPAFGSYTAYSTTRLFQINTNHTPDPGLLSRNVINVPADQTMSAGTTITLGDANYDRGTGTTRPEILDSASSGCYLDGHTLYAPQAGSCIVTYVADGDPSYYVTMSAPQFITVNAAPVAEPININIVNPPAAEAPVVITEPGTPVVTVATEPVKVVVPVENGTVSVSAPAGVLPDNSSLTVIPTTTPEAVKSGLLQVQVNAFDAGGAPITQLNKVLTLNLGKVALTGNDVAYSQDGLVWHSIAKIDGTELPEGVGEGYYIDGNGDLTILTRHLTFYGTKRLAKDLILLAPNKSHEIGTSVGLKIQGGSGTGALTYLSLTPKICSITQKGVVTALAAGECTVDAIKNGDSVYSSSTSGPLLLSIKAQKVRVFTVGKKITVQTSLSQLYANTNVDLYLLDHASRSTGFVQKVESSGRGSIRFTFLPNSLPKAFTIEVKTGDQLLATTIGANP